ncbi:MAG: hypothetical protein NVSMB51_01340 [Solirubrobacteraceae bacterium]
MQDTKVLGNVLLRGVQPLGELADRRRPVTHPVEQLDPHRLANNTKAVRNELDKWAGEWVFDLHTSQLYH